MLQAGKVISQPAEQRLIDQTACCRLHLNQILSAQFIYRLDANVVSVGKQLRLPRLGIVEPGRLEQLQQAPGIAAGLEEYVVDTKPGRGLGQCGVVDTQFAQRLGVVDARQQLLGQPREAPTDGIQPTGQALASGGKAIATAKHTVQVAGKRTLGLAVALFGRRIQPVLAIRLQRLAGTLQGVRARGTHRRQSLGEDAQLGEHAIFPTGHVVQPDPGQQHVVAQPAARLFQQRVQGRQHARRQPRATRQFGICRRPQPLRGGLVDIEGLGALAPPDAQYQTDQQIDRQQDQQGFPDPAVFGALEHLGAAFAVESRAARSVPHIGAVELQSVHCDALAAPLPSVLDTEIPESTLAP